MSEKKYTAVKITRGKRGWGGPLVIEPSDEKPYIYCVTGGGIHPVAQRIADLTGGTAFDGFSSKRDFKELAVAVIDCGGTARVGVYPMKGVPTVDVHATKPSGPLFRFIKEDLFVSGVSEAEIEVVGGETPPIAEAAESAPEAPAADVADAPAEPAVAAETAAEEKPDEPEEKKKGLFGRLFG